MAYTKSNAFARHVFSEDHPNCFVYEYEPAGGYGAWVGPRPWILSAHGGGFAPPDIDVGTDRFPDSAITNATAFLDVFLAAGYTVFLVEYPTSHHTTNNFNETLTASDYPDNFIALAQAVQWIKRNLSARVREDEGIVRANSAGAWLAAMLAWTPDSWGFFPKLPPVGGTLSHSAYRENARPRAILIDGIPGNFKQMSPDRTRGGSPAPLTVLTSVPFQVRPKITFTATLTGSIVAGDWISKVGTPTMSGTVVSIAGSAPATVVMMVQQGLATDFISTDTLEKRGATSNTLALTATPVINDYIGWLEVPEEWKQAVSPMLLLEDLTPDEIEELRLTPVYSTSPGNPSVGPNVLDDPFSVVPNLHGVDDSYFALTLEAKLNALGIVNFVRWGVAPGSNTDADAVINSATATNPVVITVNAASFFETGDIIDIAGATGMTNINGPWTLTRIGPTQFSIPVQGIGTYNAGSAKWAYRNASGNYHLTGAALGNDMKTWLQDVVGIIP